MWQVEWLTPWKMIEKLLTHLHLVVIFGLWLCWNICKGKVVIVVFKRVKICSDTLSLLSSLRGRIRQSFGDERTIGRCTGRWLWSHRTRLLANSRCCAVGRLHRRVRQSCIGRWLNIVQHSVHVDMAHSRRAGEHRTRWRVQW
jgi:hypothetical protein